MRVSTRLFYQGQQERIMRLSGDLESINEKIASGKILNRPSDNPVALMDSMAFKSSLSQLEQYQRNIQQGTTWLNLRESALTEMDGLISRAVEIGIQMANDTQSSANRANAATEIGDLFDQAIDLANTQLGGNYIFAGYKTKAPPFTKTVVGTVDTAVYGGDTNDFQIQIGKDESVVVGKNGQSALMDSNLFATLGALKKALEDNDAEAVRGQIEELKSAGDYLNNEIADIGAKSNRLETKGTIWNNLTLTLKERLSKTEDADLAEMVIELKQKQLTYQAALEATSRLSQISIMNYM